MDKNITNTFPNAITDTGYNGQLNIIRTDAGVGSLWDPTTAEKAAIADGQPVLIFFPGIQDHPPVVIQALEDPLDDATLGIPPESGLRRVLLVGGDMDGNYHPGGLGRILVYNTVRLGDFNEESSYDAYGHIPGDPEGEYRHLADYLVSTIPGADYIEQTANLATERAEVDAWRLANYAALANGVLPPSVTDLTTPVDRVAANLVLIKYPNVPQPVPPGP